MGAVRLLCWKWLRGAAFKSLQSENVGLGQNLPMHEADNRAILSLVGGDVSDPFPTAAVWADTYLQWHTNFGDVLQSEVDKQTWDTTFGEATKALGRPEGKYGKNPVHIGMHLEGLIDGGTNIPSLEKVGKQLLAFAAR